VRAFLAVPQDPAWAARAAEHLGRLRPSTPSASWTRPESWHLTLRFFAEIEPAAAERCAEETFLAASRSPGGELAFGGSVVFPPGGRPRVLGLGFVPSPGLALLEALAREAELAARRAGAEPEERGYHPHVTLARIRTPWPRGAVERFRAEADAWDLPPFRLSGVVLFESRLGPSGATHTPLRAFSWARPGRLPSESVRA
jgi:2'-5' RNA ligase